MPKDKIKGFNKYQEPKKIYIQISYYYIYIYNSNNVKCSC